MGLRCPFCEDKELIPVTIAKDTLDQCPACLGLWFNGNELGDIDELPDSELMSEFQDQLDSGTITDTKTGKADPKCPQCQNPMKRYQYDVPSGVWVYGCAASDGVWVEKGEVLKVHAHLQKSMKALPKEQQKTLLDQLKQIEEDEDRKAEEAVLSVFAGKKSSKIPLPHLMDGVCRFMYHMLFKLGV